MGRWGSFLIGLVGLAAGTAHAGTLASVFRRPAFAELGLAPLGTALATTVASVYPVASASASIVYEYNVALDTLERKTGVAGPLFGERADTIGEGRVNVGVAYSYIHLDTINGDDFDALPSRSRIGGQILFVPLRRGVRLRDGRFANFLPAQVTADVDVTAQQLAASVTYGLSPRLDVNLTVPLLHTAVDLTANGRAPDPRFPAFALAGGRTLGFAPSASEHADGVGDVLIRAKYLVYRGAPVDVAASLAIAIPSGREDDFQGAGVTRATPMVIVSRVLGSRFEPFVNAGVECNADDAGRSVVRWAVGGAAGVGWGLTAVVSFLARNELGAQADTIRRPFFFQIERNDVYDASIGARWHVEDHGTLSANVVVPLNRDGLRADTVPTLDLEYAF